MEQIKPTLYFNTIFGDFESTEDVKRSLDSIKDSVDGMYITVTYKEKEPAEDLALIALLKDYKAHVSYFKWTYNFAEARNFALQQVPKNDTTYIYWHDADDVLHGANRLKDALNVLISSKGSAMYFDYWYQVELDEKGDVREVLVKHKRERIIKHDDTWKWIGDLHETLIEQKQENVLKITDKSFDDIYVIHLTNNQRLDHNIDRNIEILEASARTQNHRDPRTLIYLAKAYYDKAKMAKEPSDRKIKLDLALNLFHEYLAGAGTPGQTGYQEASGWKEERATAWQYVGEIAILTGHPEVAIGAMQNAIDEAPEFPNYYVDLAMCYVMTNQFKKARHWLNVGTSLKEPQTTIILFPKELKTRALETSFQLNMHENKLEWALEDAKEMAKLMPDDKLAQERIVTVNSLLVYNRVCQSVVYIGKYLQDLKETDKIANLVQAIPEEMKHEKFAAEMRHLFLPPKIWGDNEIAIVCGPGFEKWDPESIQTGLGGSEEAVVYLAQELTKRGWRVTVYANPKKAGEFDGVEYRVWHDLNPKDSFNTLILWRSIGFIDVNPKAKFIMVWMHDMPNNPDFTQERVDKIDKIAVLSEYHKSQLRLHKNGLFEKMPDNKVLVTSNGIPDFDVPEWKGNPHRIIYSSSPDRGLVYLLNNWPKIKEQVTDAELHIFYGFDVFDAIYQDNPGKQQWKDRVFKMMKQDGIVYRGRIGHDALNYEFQQSGIWAYPTDFTEISCITAMKAQKNGAIPVVTDYAALSETVKSGLRIDVDITTEEGQKEYFTALIDLLKDPKRQQELREPMMKWAKDYFNWSNVAKDWDERIRVALQNPERKYELDDNTETKISGDKKQSTDQPTGIIRTVQRSPSRKK